MAEKFRLKPKKMVPLSQKIIRIIASFLVLIMVAIIFITDKGIEGIYLSFAAVQSFFASNKIEEAFTDTTFNFFSLMDSIESEYEIAVELYAPDGDFVYSSSYKGESRNHPTTTIQLHSPIR